MESERVKSVVKACTLLEAFSPQETELPLSELAQRTGLNAATARRLLVSLEAGGLIRQNRVTHRYGLGPLVLQLARVQQGYWAVADACRPFMRTLVDQCEESCYLAYYDDGRVTYLDIVESKRSVRLTARVGQSLPVHSTASGKALLAFQPLRERMRVCRQTLEAYTPATVTSRNALEETLAGIREVGWARTVAEQTEDTFAVAAPIFGIGGVSVVALAVSGPLYRMERDGMKRCAAMLVEAAREISLLLGGDPERFPPGWEQSK